ncbi:hypothetical protein SDC9_90273 [bioreactor metagenome]|uniref:Uncharacterized protein n=1 Tax=bioreactor metagenome TaxID=1076179 RepID=A0A644ZS65_9ZZZZ
MAGQHQILRAGLVETVGPQVVKRAFHSFDDLLLKSGVNFRQSHSRRKCAPGSPGIQIQGYAGGSTDFKALEFVKSGKRPGCQRMAGALLPVGGDHAHAGQALISVVETVSGIAVKEIVHGVSGIKLVIAYVRHGIAELIGQ